MHQVTCPVCLGSFPVSQIPDEVLLSEAGRRVAAKRKNPGGAGKQKGKKVWKNHNPKSHLCRCLACQWKRVERMKERLTKEIQSQDGQATEGTWEALHWAEKEEAALLALGNPILNPA